MHIGKVNEYNINVSNLIVLNIIEIEQYFPIFFIFFNPTNFQSASINYCMHVLFLISYIHFLRFLEINKSDTCHFVSKYLYHAMA